MKKKKNNAISRVFIFLWNTIISINTLWQFKHSLTPCWYSSISLEITLNHLRWKFYTYSDVTAKDLVYISLSHSPQLLRAAQHPCLSLNIWSLRAHGCTWKCFLTAEVVVTLGSGSFPSWWRCFHLWEVRVFAFSKEKSLQNHCWPPSAAAELTPELQGGGAPPSVKQTQTRSDFSAFSWKSHSHFGG